MTKLKNKIIAAITAIVMSVSMSAAVSAASSDACPPHLTEKVYIGVAYNHSLGEHEYLAEIRTSADGTVTNIYKVCYVQGIGYRYGYKCKKCGTITQYVTKNTMQHSACGF